LPAQQQPKVARIGLLIPETSAVEATRVDALRGGLRERGYVEGKNIFIELRSAEGNYNRLPDLATEMTKLKVDLIVAFGTKAVSAAQRATTTIPIVDPVMGDSIAIGLSNSLARPSANITGSIQFSPETGGKRLEFLKEAIPRIAWIAVLINPANAGNPLQLETMRVTAHCRNRASTRCWFRRTPCFAPTLRKLQIAPPISSFRRPGPGSFRQRAA